MFCITEKPRRGMYNKLLTLTLNLMQLVLLLKRHFFSPQSVSANQKFVYVIFKLFLLQLPILSRRSLSPVVKPSWSCSRFCSVKHHSIMKLLRRFHHLLLVYSYNCSNLNVNKQTNKQTSDHFTYKCTKDMLMKLVLL